MFNFFFAKIHKKTKISVCISEIFIIFANAFYRRKPEGLSGGCDFYGIERLLTFVCDYS